MKVLLRIFLLFLLLTTAKSAFSQLSAGARIGLNSAIWISDDPDFDDVGFRGGLIGGAVLEWRFNRIIALQAEAGLVQRGYKVEDYFKALMNYLEVPVMFKVGGGNKVRFDGMAGFGLGYAMNAKRCSYFGNDKICEDIDFDDTNLSRVDFTLHLGGAVAFKVAERARVFVDLRFMQGFVNLNSDANFGDYSYLNTNFAIGSGVLFQLTADKE